VTRTTERVAAAVEPVSRAAGELAGAARPALDATRRVAGAARPVLDATGRVADAARPLLDATGQVAGVAKPLLDTAAGVAGSVTAPAVRLGGAVAPVGDIVGGVTRPVGRAFTGDRSSSPDRGGTSQSGATFGRPGSGGPPSGDVEGAGSRRSGAGDLAGSQGAVPEVLLGGATPHGPVPTAPGADSGAGAGSGPVSGSGRGQAPTGVASDQPGVAAPRGPGAILSALATGHLAGAAWLPGLAPASPQASTSTSPLDGRGGQASPEQRPTPSPSAPAGSAAAGSASAGSAGPVLALLALLLLAAPTLSLLFRTVPEFLRPAPFIVALERPG
jgi:hypothetical protein